MDRYRPKKPVLTKSPLRKKMRKALVPMTMTKYKLRKELRLVPLRSKGNPRR